MPRAFLLLAILLLAAPSSADPGTVGIFHTRSGFGLDALGRPGRTGAPAPSGGRATLSAAGDGRWIELGPPTRQYPRIVADLAHHRLVLFGGVGAFSGHDVPYSNSVWTLATDRPSSWKLMDIAGDLPEPRAGHECVYDAARHRLILFGGFRAIPIGGGYVTFRYFDDTWALSLDGTPRWTELSAGGPGPRTIPACAYDSKNDRLVLAGGYFFDDANQDPNYEGDWKDDVWTLPLGAGGSWNEATPKNPGPGARTFALLAYDGAADRFIAFGGNHEGGPRGVEPLFDVWALQLGTASKWQALGAGGEPPTPRTDGATAWDSVRRKVLLLGGWFDEVNYYVPDSWSYDVGAETWQGAGAGPTDRLYPGVAFDAASDALYLAFGARGFLNLNDTWRRPSAQGDWVEAVPPGSPFPSASASAAFDAAGRRVVTFGGDSYDEFYPKGGEVYDGLREWKVDEDSWSPLAAAGPAPPPRTRAATAFDTRRRRMWVVGGESGVRAFTDAWALELGGGPRWWQAPDGLHPGQRYGLTTAVYDSVGDRVLYFGGDTGPGHDEIWSLSSEGAWSLLEVDAHLPYRLSTNAVMDTKRHRVLVLAGDLSGQETSDLWALDLDGRPSWHALAAEGDSPLPVDYGRAVYDARADRVLLFGGGKGDPFGEQDRAAYELALEGTPRWRRLEPSGSPATARWMHVLAFDDRRNRMLVTGGAEVYAWHTDSWALQFDRPTINVALDVRPVLPARSRGPVPVGLLSAPGFEPGEVDLATLVFGGAPGLPGRTPARDLNGDGVEDLVVDFDGARMDRTSGQLELTGALNDGTPIEGSVRMTLRPSASLNQDHGTPLQLAFGGRATSGGWALDLSLPAAGAWQLELYDVRGRRILERTGTVAKAGWFPVQVDFAGPSGIYFARLRQSNSVALGRLAITR